MKSKTNPLEEIGKFLLEIEKSEHIVRTVQHITGRQLITNADKLPESRSRETAQLFARYHAMHFLRKHTTLTLDEIGVAVCPLKPFDHSTVIHAIQTAQDLIDTMEGREDFYKHYMMLHNFFIGSETLN
jgi:chromosomal replication initiation ATPase DnaA